MYVHRQKCTIPITCIYWALSWWPSGILQHLPVATGYILRSLSSLKNEFNLFLIISFEKEMITEFKKIATEKSKSLWILKKLINLKMRKTQPLTKGTNIKFTNLECPKCISRYGHICRNLCLTRVFGNIHYNPFLRWMSQLWLRGMSNLYNNAEKIKIPIYKLFK